jgi:hypothetical protein
VPNEAVDLVEVDPVLAAVLGDQAQLDPLRALGDGEKLVPAPS